MSVRKYTGRTRAFTFPETLHAISHAATRPGRRVAVPSSIRPLNPVNATAPAAELVLDDRSVVGIAGWARAMLVGPDLITVTRAVGPSVMLKITGQLSSGLVVSVVAWVEDWPFEVAKFASRVVSTSDFVSIALNALAEEPEDAPRHGHLVGAS